MLQKSSLLLNVSESSDNVFTTLTGSPAEASLQLTSHSRTASKAMRALPSKAKSPTVARGTSPLRQCSQKPSERKESSTGLYVLEKSSPTKSPMRSSEILSGDLTPLHRLSMDSSQRSSPSHKRNSGRAASTLDGNCADSFSSAGLETDRQARERRKIELSVRVNELKATARGRMFMGEGHGTGKHDEELRRQNELDQVASLHILLYCSVSLFVSSAVSGSLPRD